MGRKLQLVGLMMMVGALSVGCSQSKQAESTSSPEVSTEASTEAVTDETAEASAETTPETTEAAEEETKETTDQTASASGAAAITPATTGQELVDAAFTTADAHHDFKVEYTQDFLDKVDTMYSLLDDRYKPEYDDECAFYVNEDRSQLEFSRDITDYDERYKYIYEVKNYLGFEDAQSDLYGWQKLSLNLCDEDNDGKIELNDVSSTILTTFNPDIDLEEVQKCIDQSIANEKVESYETVKIDSDDKYYGSVHFSWYRYQDNPVQVEIQLDWYQNYPEN